MKAKIAGRIAEVVSGKSWEELFQERIAKPLEMRQNKLRSFAGAGERDRGQIGGIALSQTLAYRRLGPESRNFSARTGFTD